MVNWFVRRNGRVLTLVLIFIILLGLNQTMFALTILPESPIQDPVPLDSEPEAPPTEEPEQSDVASASPEAPVDPSAPELANGGPSGWFANRDCAAPLRIMLLGNSITRGRGSGVPPNQENDSYATGYRYPLDQLLNADKYQFDFVGGYTHGASSGYTFDMDHQGLPGQRLDEMMGEVDDYLTANPPDLILLHIGTNDVTQTDSSNHIADLNTLLNNIDNFSTDIPIIIARIINEEEGHPNSTHGTLITNYNSVTVQSVADTRIGNGDRLVVVDMEMDTGLIYTSGSADFFDRLHPNATGYTKMAPVWFAALEDIWPTCAPEITSTAPTTAVVEQPFTYDVNATADPTATYALVGTPPAGMSIITETGVINWTPMITQSGQIMIEVEATNIAGSDTQPFTLQVQREAQITSSPVTTAFQGVLYTYQVSADGYPAPTFSLTDPPPGMSIDSVTGLVTWNVSIIHPLGAQNVTVNAENSLGTDTQPYTIDVQQGHAIFLPVLLK